MSKTTTPGCGISLDARQKIQVFRTLGVLSLGNREGRLITFPNIIQHRVDSFRLQDPTKAGHRKIVALFLVNPHTKVLSSAQIPCQRKDWWDDG